MAASSPLARDAYEIHSPRLIVRTAIKLDAESMREFITNPDNNPHTPTESNVTIESMQTRIGKWQESTAKGIRAFQVIILRSTGELIGYGGYNCFDLIEEPSEDAAPRYLTDIGTAIAKSHWRKGYGLEALCALTEYAFAELGIARVRIETNLSNEPWRRLMHAVGLAQFESQQKVTFGEKPMGYTWHFDAANWQAVKEDMQRRDKWPL
ncbi:acetyltransferase [Xylaria grammica]|nr:acetyltransferase [Xylaria grammica]